MRILLMMLLISVNFFYAEASSSPKTIRLASAEWQGYTGKDGTGIYWDVLRAVYERAGVNIQMNLMPWKRAELMAQSGEVDALVAEYYLPKLYDYPKYQIDVDKVMAFYLKDRIQDFSGYKNLDGYTLAWFRGYDFHKHMKLDEDYTEFDSLSQGVQLLFRERVDIVLDYLGAFKRNVEAEGLSMDLIEYQPVYTARIYLCFHKNKRNKALIDLWDRRMQEMDSSGELDEIYKRYTDIYPNGYPRGAN